MSLNKLILVSLAAVLLNACASHDRYSIKNDRAPKQAVDVSHVEDAHPQYEPYSRGGNKTTYTVRGKQYQVLKTGKGYVATGIASWYGKKFHGHLTSNGETYDMYSMSAAHKTLPLPSFVKVTNLANDKTVIVRVNDRGPFHDNRIIDLSYAAAHRLDMLKTGTAKVKIEVIFIPKQQTAISKLKGTQQHFVQVVASSNKLRLQQLAQTLETQYTIKSRVTGDGKLFRLQLGPIADTVKASKLADELKLAGYPTSYLITE